MHQFALWLASTPPSVFIQEHNAWAIPAIQSVHIVGIGLVRNWNAAQAAVVGEFLHVASYSLSVVPLFVLMGNFVTRGGLSRDLYQAANAFLGHRRGGLVASKGR